MHHAPVQKVIIIIIKFVFFIKERVFGMRKTRSGFVSFLNEKNIFNR